MTEICSSSPVDTEMVGEMLAKELHAGDVIALYGDLGAGKTQFVRGLARGLQVNSMISSPTFAIVHSYEGPIPFYHFDMYRIGNWDELESTGFFDYLDGGGICAIEWSENIENALPDNAIHVRIDKGRDENTRQITIEGISFNHHNLEERKQ